MKFSIVKKTSDDEHTRYLVEIGAPILVGMDRGKIDFFTFSCSDADREMMMTALSLQIKPHPQRSVKGCPCLGYRTCEDCAGNYQQLLKRLITTSEIKP